MRRTHPAGWRDFEARDTQIRAVGSLSYLFPLTLFTIIAILFTIIVTLFTIIVILFRVIVILFIHIYIYIHFTLLVIDFILYW